MDIDITDSTFSLDIPDINSEFGNILEKSTSDYTMYIYIGVAILVSIIGMFIFKFYQNKMNAQNVNDCEGGFCTMNQNVQHN
jgi:hypothetical protein